MDKVLVAIFLHVIFISFLMVQFQPTFDMFFPRILQKKKEKKKSSLKYFLAIYLGSASFFLYILTLIYPITNKK